MSGVIYILNGPNLNMLGMRQPEIYGADTLSDLEEACRSAGEKKGFSIFFAQSNAENELIEWIQEAIEEAVAIIINPAAYSHTSIAILDALNIFEGKVVEVHISDIHKREKFRHHSYVSLRADKVISGKGLEGYLLAINYLDD